MPREIWFTLCIRVDFSAAMFPHFLRNYLGLGIPSERFLLVLSTRKRFGPALREARRAATEAGMRSATTWVRRYTSEVKQRTMRRLLDHYQKHGCILTEEE